MTDALVRAGGWLVLQAGTLPAAARDTLLFRNVASPPSTFDTVTRIAGGLLTLAVLALAVALVPAAWNFRQSYKKINHLIERVYGDINPIMRHASSIADNLDYVTTSIRTDVQQVNATIAAANRRLQDAVALTEGRLRDFNALLEVVQEEAEQAFVSAAATVRGVRTSAAALSEDVPIADDGPALAMDEDAVLDAEASALEPEEIDDGYDGEPESAARPIARPRVRPRPRRRD